MVRPEDIFQAFPELTPHQREQIVQLESIYKSLNQRVNLISRKDIDNFYTHHVMHSLALAKFCTFPAGAKVIDIGTGGGFPGIPLAIFYPETKFILCDSIGKKIRAVEEAIDLLELKNATAINARTESLTTKFDIAVARAVAPMSNLWNWMQGHWNNKPHFCLLKGGDLSAEMNELLEIAPKVQFHSNDISDVFNHSFFETKKVIEIIQK